MRSRFITPPTVRYRPMSGRPSIKGSAFQMSKLSGLTAAPRRQRWHTAAEAPYVPSTAVTLEQND